MKTGAAGQEAAILSRFQGAEDRLRAVGPDWLHALRRRGLERFQKTGFPGVYEEAWRFTSLKTLEKTEFSYRPGAGLDTVTPEEVGSASFAGDQPVRLVFVDGAFAGRLSRPSPGTGGVRVLDLAAALRDHESVLKPVLGRLADPERHRFSALNAAFLGDGALVHAPAGSVGPVLVHLLFLSRSEGSVHHPRVLILADEGSQVTVLEEYQGPASLSAFTNPVTEVLVGRNASVNHTRLEREGESTFHVGTLSARLDRDARFTSHSVSLGGKLVRTDIDVVLEGEGAECTLNGLYLADGRRHVDHHTHVDHVAAHTASRQLYKGVLDGKATAVFNGRILIRPGAQKIDASQTNNNLLLSAEALVNTNPELEIFADDVKAQHGATIGQIDDDQLFYLRSRGIDERRARNLLIYAFSGEMIERVSIDPVRTALTDLMGRSF